MVRDVRNHSFSFFDCLWLLRKGVILPRALGQYELMTQRGMKLTSMLIEQWFELAPGLILLFDLVQMS